jgi:hypothetical protein
MDFNKMLEFKEYIQDLQLKSKIESLNLHVVHNMLQIFTLLDFTKDDPEL